MTIPPKYEDVVFQLNELNKREAALREELATLRESYESMRDRKNSIVDLQQRLTVAEQLLRETLPHLRFCKGMGRKFSEKVDGLDLRIESALKPAAEGEGTKPQEAYEVFPDSPGGYYNGCPPSALADPMQCWRDGYEIAKKRAITAGLKVKP